MQTDNQANLYGGARTGVSTDKAVKFYLANGATAGKINMGIPLYGRAFENTAGLGQSYNGVRAHICLTRSAVVLTLRILCTQIGPGTIEAGVYSYKALPIAGATVFENTTDVSSYSYDSSSKELVSYDTPHITTLKAQYVQTNGLSGSMFWEVCSFSVAYSTDHGLILCDSYSSRRTRPVQTRSLVPLQGYTVALTGRR